MAINAEVVKHQNENPMSLLRRFKKRAQSAGVIARARQLRFYTRRKSRNFTKQAAIEAAKRRERVQELAKLGLLKPKKKRR